MNIKWQSGWWLGQLGSVSLPCMQRSLFIIKEDSWSIFSPPIFFVQCQMDTALLARIAGNTRLQFKWRQFKHTITLPHIYVYFGSHVFTGPNWTDFHHCFSFFFSTSVFFRQLVGRQKVTALFLPNLYMSICESTYWDAWHQSQGTTTLWLTYSSCGLNWNNYEYYLTVSPVV